MKLSLPKLVISILVPLAAGFLGSAVTVSAIDNWYQFLNKPLFAPPNYIFGPVWTTLYILMGFSLYLLWISKKKEKILAIRLFLLQLCLNFIWSILFFGMHNIAASFAEIIALWALIVLTIRQSYLVSKPAAYLMYPYIIWVTIASILNFSLLILN